MPSQYLGCGIVDDIADSADLFKSTLQEVEAAANEIISNIKEELDQMSGEKKYASATLGSEEDRKIKWTAVEAGEGGNEISIEYIFLGPAITSGLFVPRQPSAVVRDKRITLVLPVTATGAIDPTKTIAQILDDWMAITEVSDLVTGELAGDGTGSGNGEEIPSTFLSGGKGTPLKDAESAANDTARQFGQPSYQDLLRSIDVPVVENEADAAAYLELSGEYVIVGKKIFLVEGTNLVAIRALYNIFEKDVSKLKKFLERIYNKQNQPHLFISEDVVSTVYILVCNEPTPIVSTKEVYLEYNQPIKKVARQYTNNDISVLNAYIIWPVEPTPTFANRYKIVDYWGFESDHMTWVLSGQNIPDDVVGDVKADGTVLQPSVFIMDDPALFIRLGLTDAEISELLDKETPGIAVPPDTAIGDLTENDQEILPNGMSTKVNKALVAPQAVDISKQGKPENAAKEMAIKGKACARKRDNMKNLSVKKLRSPPKIKPFNPSKQQTLNPGAVNKIADKKDLPNMPSADLPDFSKKLESAFGAFSSVTDVALKTFDRMMKLLTGAITAAMNKIQNVMSMMENVLNNDLAQCLMGIASVVTGALSGALGLPPISGSLPSLTGAGGLTSPLAALNVAIKDMSKIFETSLTTSFSAAMGLIRTPLCMITTMLKDILGIFKEAAGALSPCKDALDPNDKCPPQEGADTIDASEELSNLMKTIEAPGKALEETEKAVTEAVQDFTGKVTKAIQSAVTKIEDGIKEIMDKLLGMFSDKLKVVDKLNKSIQKLTRDMASLAAGGKKLRELQSQCMPPATGMLMDSIKPYF